MLQLLQSYFTIITLEVYTQEVKRACLLLLILHNRYFRCGVIYFMFGADQFLNVLILTLLCVRFVWFVKMTELPPVRERATDSACHLYL